LSQKLEFDSLTGKVTIDYGICGDCGRYDCVKACSLYGRGILRIQDGRPVLTVCQKETKRRCIECLACEIQCLLKANGAVKIELPILGLDKYKRR
jgi:hypothetical protein